MWLWSPLPLHYPARLSRAIMPHIAVLCRGRKQLWRPFTRIASSAHEYAKDTLSDAGSSLSNVVRTSKTLPRATLVAAWWNALAGVGGSVAIWLLVFGWAPQESMGGDRVAVVVDFMIWSFLGFPLSASAGLLLGGDRITQRVGWIGCVIFLALIIGTVLMTCESWSNWLQRDHGHTEAFVAPYFLVALYAFPSVLMLWDSVRFWKRSGRRRPGRAKRMDHGRSSD